MPLDLILLDFSSSLLFSIFSLLFIFILADSGLLWFLDKYSLYEELFKDIISFFSLVTFLIKFLIFVSIVYEFDLANILLNNAIIELYSNKLLLNIKHLSLLSMLLL